MSYPSSCLIRVILLFVAEHDGEEFHGALQLSGSERDALKNFLGKSVTAGTLQGYRPGWEKWQAYLLSRRIGDPYLEECSELEKVSHLCNFFRVRYEEGKRGKAAYGVGAAVKKFYALAFQPLGFFDNPMATTARTAYRRSTDELREYQRFGGGHDKLPVFWELMAWLRDHLWKGKGWHYPEIVDKMTSIGSLLAYDLANRGGEVTTVGGAAKENHSINNEQVSFRLEEPVSIRGVVYFAVAAGSEDFRRYVQLSNVASCEIEVASHKAGALSSHNK